MSVLFADALTRADAATLGGNYVQLKGETGRIGVFSNQADVGTAATDCGDAIDAGISWPNDQYMQATFVALASSEGLLWVRGEAVAGATKNGYQGGTDFGNEGDQFTVLLKRVADVWTQLAHTGVADISAGSTVRLEVTGAAPATLTIFVGGVQRASVTDSSFASGKPGLSAIHSAGDVALFDNLEAGDFVSAAAPVLVPSMMAGPRWRWRVPRPRPSVDAPPVVVVTVDDAQVAVHQLHSSEGYPGALNAPVILIGGL